MQSSNTPSYQLVETEKNVPSTYDTKVDIELPDITIDESQDMGWQEWLALGIQTILGVGLPIAAHTYYTHAMKKSINNLKPRITDKLDVTKRKIDQFNDDLRELNTIQIQADKYRDSLSQMPQSDQNMLNQVNEWQNLNWQNFFTKYSISPSDMESNIKALNGPNGQGLPEILKNAMRDEHWVHDRLKVLTTDLAKDLSQKVFTIKGKDLEEVAKLFPEAEKAIDNYLLTHKTDDINEIREQLKPTLKQYKSQETILENDIKKHYKEILTLKNADSLNDLLERAGLDTKRYENNYQNIKQLVEHPELLYTEKKFKDVFKDVSHKDAAGKKLDGMDKKFTDLAELIVYTNTHHELDKTTEAIKKKVDTQVNKEIKQRLNTEYKDVLDKVKQDKTKAIDDVNLQVIKKLYPELGNQINEDYRRLLKQEIENKIRETEQVLKARINEEDAPIETFKRLYDIYGDDVKDGISQVIKLKANSIPQMIQEFKKKGPEAAKLIEQAIKGNVKEELLNIDGAKEILNVIQQPFYDIGIERLKHKMIDRFNKGDSFSELQLPESKDYQFDFVNANEKELKEFQALFNTNRMWKKLIKADWKKELPTSIKEALTDSKKIREIWNRAQDLKNNTKTELEYQELKDMQVDPILKPFLINSNVSNLPELRKYVRTHIYDNKNPYEKQLMEYNLYANDPSLYLNYDANQNIAKDILNELEVQTGIALKELSTNSDLIKALSNGDFSTVGKILTQSAKDRIKQTAKFYLMTEPFDPKESQLVQRYKTEDVPEFVLNGNIFQESMTPQDRIKLQNHIRNIKDNIKTIDDMIFNGYTSVKRNSKLADEVPYWIKDRTWEGIDYQVAQSVLQDMRKDMTQRLKTLENDYNNWTKDLQKKYTIETQHKLPSNVKRFKPKTKGISWKEEQQPSVNNAMKNDEQLDKKLQNNYDEHKKLLQTMPSDKISEIITDFEKKRREIINTHNVVNTKPSGTTNVSIKDMDQPKIYYTTEQMLNRYIDQYKAKQTHDSNRLINKHTKGVSTGKGKGRDEKIQAFKQYFDKLLNDKLSDDLIKEYNQFDQDLQKVIGSDDITLTAIPPREPNQSWRDWANDIYGYQTAERFKQDIPLPVDYNGWGKRNLVQTSISNGDSWMIDQIKKHKHEYDYNKSLIDNFKDLSRDQQDEILQNGLPVDIDKKFEKYIIWKNERKPYRSLPQEIVAQMDVDKEKQKQK